MSQQCSRENSGYNRVTTESHNLCHGEADHVYTYIKGQGITISGLEPHIKYMLHMQENQQNFTVHESTNSLKKAVNQTVLMPMLHTALFLCTNWLGPNPLIPFKTDYRQKFNKKISGKSSKMPKETWNISCSCTAGTNICKDSVISNKYIYTTVNRTLQWHGYEAYTVQVTTPLKSTTIKIIPVPLIDLIILITAVKACYNFYHL